MWVLNDAKDNIVDEIVVKEETKVDRRYVAGEPGDNSLSNEALLQTCVSQRSESEPPRVLVKLHLLTFHVQTLHTFAVLELTMALSIYLKMSNCVACGGLTSNTPHMET